MMAKAARLPTRSVAVKPETHSIPDIDGFRSLITSQLGSKQPVKRSKSTVESSTTKKRQITRSVDKKSFEFCETIAKLPLCDASGATVRCQIAGEVVLSGKTTLDERHNKYVVHRRNYIHVKRARYKLQGPLGPHQGKLYLRDGGYRPNKHSIVSLQLSVSGAKGGDGGEHVQLLHYPNAQRDNMVNPAPIPLLPHQDHQSKNGQGQNGPAIGGRHSKTSSNGSDSSDSDQNTCEWTRIHFPKATEHNGERRNNQAFYCLLLTLTAYTASGDVRTVAVCPSPQFIVFARSPGGLKSIQPKAESQSPSNSHLSPGSSVSPPQYHQPSRRHQQRSNHPASRKSKRLEAAGQSISKTSTRDRAAGTHVISRGYTTGSYRKHALSTHYFATSAGSDNSFWGSPPGAASQISLAAYNQTHRAPSSGSGMYDFGFSAGLPASSPSTGTSCGLEDVAMLDGYHGYHVHSDEDIDDDSGTGDEDEAIDHDTLEDGQDFEEPEYYDDDDDEQDSRDTTTNASPMTSAAVPSSTSTTLGSTELSLHAKPHSEAFSSWDDPFLINAQIPEISIGNFPSSNASSAVTAVAAGHALPTAVSRMPITATLPAYPSMHNGYMHIKGHRIDGRGVLNARMNGAGKSGLRSLGGGSEKAMQML